MQSGQEFTFISWLVLIVSGKFLQQSLREEIHSRWCLAPISWLRSLNWSAGSLCKIPIGQYGAVLMTAPVDDSFRLPPLLLWYRPVRSFSTLSERFRFILWHRHFIFLSVHSICWVSGWREEEQIACDQGIDGRGHQLITLLYQLVLVLFWSCSWEVCSPQVSWKPREFKFLCVNQLMGRKKGSFWSSPGRGGGQILRVEL